jgi:predicted RNA-binding Zn-ribbon protein involved in translation (DUF1610 family)
MKDKKEICTATEQPMEAIPVEAIEQKNFVINCYKCGAALNVSSGKTAYVCPVCGSLLRMRAVTRIVKEIPVKEKYVHITLTEKAAKHILLADKEYKAQQANKKRARRCIFRRRKKAVDPCRQTQLAMESLIEKHIGVNKYEEGDVLLIDADDQNLSITTAKVPTQS